MKIKYDAEADVVKIVFKNSKIKDSEQEKPGMIFDYDIKDNVIGIQILNASKRIDMPQGVDYEVALYK